MSAYICACIAVGRVLIPTHLFLDAGELIEFICDAIVYKTWYAMVFASSNLMNE